MAREGSGVMSDQLDVPLEDSELLDEVELTTNLIIAASESDGSLPQGEVDRLLGLSGGEHPQSGSAGHSAEQAIIPRQKARRGA